MSVIAREISINATPEAAWAVLSDYNGIDKWSPNVEGVRGLTEIDHGVGAVRACTVPGFGDIEETVVEWRDGESVSFEVSAFGPLKKALSTWSVRDEGGKAVVRVRVELETKYGALGTAMEKLVMRRKFAGVMEESLLGLKHHVETGEEVGTELPEGLDSDTPVEVAA